MKKVTLTFLILCAAYALTYAGTQSYSGKDKEVVQQAPPPCDWYKAHEWDFSFWGTFAFSGNTGENDVFDGERGPEDGSANDIGHVSNNRLFGGRDEVWGGGLDIKYFFSKYWALGAEGFILDSKYDILGAGLGTFTFRYPIGCSRFAPYAWAGFGVIQGGSHTIRIFSEDQNNETEFERHEFFTRHIEDKGPEPMGQIGTGLEIRLLRPSAASKLAVGLMADFSWNIVEGGQNNFGMARFGVNVAY